MCPQGVDVEVVFLDHVGAVGENGVDIAHDLEFLEEILDLDPDAFANQFHQVDDLEGPAFAEVAGFAVAGMEDDCERVNAGFDAGVELLCLEPVLEVRQERQNRFGRSMFASNPCLHRRHRFTGLSHWV